jgi:voltage-gated potassium channel
MDRAEQSAREFRRRVYEILERGSPGDRVSLAVDRGIVALIIINLVAVALESVPNLQARYGFFFDLIEAFSLAVFTVEYLLRLWIAVEHTPFHHLSPARRRLRYATSAAGVVDLLAVLPFWFALLLPADVRVVLVLRMVRFLKIARYLSAMRTLLDVLYGERRALFGCGVIMIGVTLIAASLMHLIEGRVQPDKFGTIPEAMWWAYVTVGTIGYGDVVPVTALGKLVAAATIFFGLIMIALPVGIIANAFGEELHRRDFVVTWSMVAKVPLFSGLDAGEVAAVMRLLRAQQVEAGEVIVRRGEPGHSMYLIAAGEVEIALPNERTRLGVGHFFGEIAVLQRTRRSATITAMTRTSLLVLDAGDLRALMDRDQRIAERVHEMARGRLKHELVTPRGDLLTEEIEEEPPQAAR